MCKQLALIPLLAGLLFAFCAKTAAGQNVQTMSITELMSAVNSKMESVNNLTDEEKEELNSLILKIQRELNFKVPPPPPPAPKSESKEKKLQRVVESLQEHSRFYAGIKPVPENRVQLERSYYKLMTLYDEVVKIENEIKENPPPPPPKPLKPAKRIKEHAKKSTPPPPEPTRELREKNLLNSRMQPGNASKYVPNNFSKAF